MATGVERVQSWAAREWRETTPPVRQAAVAGVVVIVLLSVILALSNRGSGGHPAATATVTACTAVAGQPTAVVDVTNPTSAAHAYFVTVRFSGPGGDYGRGTASGTVEPGATSQIRVMTDGDVTGSVSCAVERVQSL